MLVLCLTAFGGANLLTGMAGGFGSLLAFRLLAGIAAAGIAPQIYAGVGEAAPAGRRATWMAIAVSGLLLALALGAPLGGIASTAWGWRMPFDVLAGASILLAAANRLVWPRRRLPTAPELTSAPVDIAVIARRMTPTVLWATGLYGVYTYLGVGLTGIGYAPAQIARAIALYGIGALVGALVGGRAADRYGVFATMRASLVGLAGCLLALGAALGSAWTADLALVSASIMAQLFFPAQQASLVQDFPARRATMLAWNNSALFLGISLGSLVGGVAVSWIGFAGAIAVCAAIVAAAMGSVTAVSRPSFATTAAKARAG